MPKPVSRRIPCPYTSKPSLVGHITHLAIPSSSGLSSNTKLQFRRPLCTGLPLFLIFNLSFTSVNSISEIAGNCKNLAVVPESHCTPATNFAWNCMYCGILWGCIPDACPADVSENDDGVRFRLTGTPGMSDCRLSRDSKCATTLDCVNCDEACQAGLQRHDICLFDFNDENPQDPSDRETLPLTDEGEGDGRSSEEDASNEQEKADESAESPNARSESTSEPPDPPDSESTLQDYFWLFIGVGVGLFGFLFAVISCVMFRCAYCRKRGVAANAMPTSTDLVGSRSGIQTTMGADAKAYEAVAGGVAAVSHFPCSPRGDPSMAMAQKRNHELRQEARGKLRRYRDPERPLPPDLVVTAPLPPGTASMAAQHSGLTRSRTGLGLDDGRNYRPGQRIGLGNPAVERRESGTGINSPTRPALPIPQSPAHRSKSVNATGGPPSRNPTTPSRGHLEAPSPGAVARGCLDDHGAITKSHSQPTLKTPISAEKAVMICSALKNAMRSGPTDFSTPLSDDDFILNSVSAPPSPSPPQG